jgi:hypothetical protein
MYFEVNEARYAGKYQIQLLFEDGSSGVVDLMNFIEEGTALAPLKDPALFKAFSIEYGTVVWKSHSLDIAPETLYREATGKEVTFKNQTNAIA